VATYDGDVAVERLARLAAGLESVVVGEDQILGQVRQLKRDAESGETIGAGVVRALDLAIRVGRRARAERPRGARSLAERGLAWVASRRDVAGARVLVVGTGPIGADAARLARRSGSRVIVASRRPEGRSGRRAGASLTLREAATAIADADAVVVALAGPWSELLLGGDLLPPPLPLFVDLSAPPAIPGPVRAALGGRLATLDDLAAAGDPDRALSRAYRQHADRLVDDAVKSWRQTARPESTATIRSLRTTAETKLATSIERLWRRLPELDDRQRALIEQHTRQVVATVLHGPTLRLRDDADGRRTAVARELFGL
ncbi:MAG: hypothetical protein L0227_04335, partial [Chloroflexi bacterium]|nr:hypothetical protein [Chloroflexota bacterium]